MRSEANADLSGLGHFLNANKGLVILAGLSLIAVVVYWRQQGPTDLVYTLIRAGAHVDRVQAAGQVLYDVDFSGANIGKRELRLLAQLSTIRSLNLSQTPLTDRELSLLATIPSLTDLDLSDVHLSSETLIELGKLPRLRRLVLANCPITDDLLPLLASYPSLADLDLARTPVTDAGLIRLREIAHLAVLNLSGAKVGDPGMAALALAPHLAELDIGSTNLTNAGLKSLQQAAGLQSLRLSGTKVTDAGLPLLQPLSRLRRLDLSMLPVTDVGLGCLTGLSRLEVLELQHTRITDAGLIHLRRLPLRELVLSFTPVTDAGMDVVKELHGLERLEIDGSLCIIPAEMAGGELLAQYAKNGSFASPSITDQGLRRLSDLGQLRVLRLANASITDAGLVYLAGLRNLRELYLSGAPITDAGLRHLAGLTELRKLDLGGTSLRGPGLAHLAGLAFLRTLTLYETDVGDAHIEHLQRLPDLTRLDLSATQITDDALLPVGKMFSLKQLRLGRTAVTDAGLAHLKSLNRLRNLSLGGTQVTDDGLQHVKNLPGLIEIEAYGTSVTLATAQAFLDKTPPVRVLVPGQTKQRPVHPHLPDWEAPLDEQRVDALGDPLPKGARARLGTTRLFVPECQRLQLTPDGKTLIAAGDGKCIYLWDARDGRLRHTLRNQTRTRLSGLALSPDGQILASTGDGNVVRLWETASGKPVREIHGPWIFATALAFSPDGQNLAVVSLPEGVWVVDVPTGKPILRLHGPKRRRQSQGANEMFGSVAFAPDGKTLAGCSEQTTIVPSWQEVNGQRRLIHLSKPVGVIRVWQWPGGKPLARLEGIVSYLSGFSYAHSGRTIVAPVRDGTLILWDAATGQKLRRIPTGNKHVTGIPLVLSDGRTAVVRRQDGWVRCDLSTAEQVGRLEAPGGNLAVSADEKVLATDRGGDNESYLALWDARTGKELVSLERHRGLAYSRPVEYAPDGKTLATAGRDETIRLWDRATGRPVRTIDVAGWEPSWVCFSPNSRLLAACLTSKAGKPKRLPARVRVWDAGTARVVFETPAEGWRDETAVAPAFGPDSLLVVGRNPPPWPPQTVKAHSAVLLYDMRTGQARQLDAGVNPIHALALSPDGRLLAWAGNQGAVGIADRATLQVLRRLPESKIDENELGSLILRFSPNGKRLAISIPGKGVLLTDCIADAPIRSFSSFGKTAVEALWFRPSGELLAAGQAVVQTRSGSVSDVWVWDVVSGKSVRRTWRTEEVRHLTFAPDGAELATAHTGGVVLLWSLDAEGLPAKPQATDAP